MADINLMTLTADIVASHVSNNDVATADLPALIATTYDALASLGAPEAPAKEAPTYEPAVSVRKSLADPDRIVSMIDGKPYSALKRHLAAHGLTPASYRQRYGLRHDYPMVAPGYSAARREISLKLGLGRGKAAAAPASAPAPAAEPATTPAPATTRGRRPRLRLGGAAALDKVRSGSGKPLSPAGAGDPANGEQQGG